MKVVAIALLALLLPAAALAAPPLWTVDRAHSRLAFSSTVSGKGFTGSFRSWDAVIHFDPKDLAHSDVAATVDMASFVTGNADRDALLPSEDWFWVGHFPKATFVAHGFQPAGAGRYLAAGTLTLRGVAKPLTLPFTLTLNGPTATMNAQVSLNRLAFGVGQGDWQATDTVPAAVTVDVALTAHR